MRKIIGVLLGVLLVVLNVQACFCPTNLTYLFAICIDIIACGYGVGLALPNLRRLWIKISTIVFGYAVVYILVQLLTMFCIEHSEYGFFQFDIQEIVYFLLHSVLNIWFIVITLLGYLLVVGISLPTSLKCVDCVCDFGLNCIIIPVYKFVFRKGKESLKRRMGTVLIVAFLLINILSFFKPLSIIVIVQNILNPFVCSYFVALYIMKQPNRKKRIISILVGLLVLVFVFSLTGCIKSWIETKASFDIVLERFMSNNLSLVNVVLYNLIYFVSGAMTLVLFNIGKVKHLFIYYDE